MAIDTAQRASPIEDVYPLSALQEALLSSSRAPGEPGQDIEQVVGELHETLDVNAFSAAWERMVQRHAILRTTFNWSSPEQRPRQEVHRKLPAPITQMDWRGWPAAHQESAYREWLHVDRCQAFDLAHPPLWRVTLFQLADTHFRLVWTFHHALLDATAFAIVLEEWFSVYQTICNGTEPKLPPATPYRTALEQLNQFDSQKAGAFWAELLNGFEGSTALGIERAVEDAGEGPSFAEQQTQFTSAETALLRNAAQKHQVTLSTLLHGAWSLILARYGRVDDVVFGTIHGGRAAQMAQRTVGLTINTLPMRVKFPPGMQVGLWLRSLRQQLVQIREFEQTPLLSILESSSGREGRPLFDTVVNFQNPAWHDRLRELGGAWKNRDFKVINQPRYSLWLDAWASDRLSLRVGFRRAAIEAEAIGRLLQHLRTGLMRLSTIDPNAAIDQLDVITEEERHRVLFEWNQTSSAVPANHTVQDLFSEKAQHNAEALAVAGSDRRLSYGELNSLANRLAHFLQKLGAAPERRIAVCMDRSPELVLAELAILKSGAAFVALDPAYPQERLEFMIGDSECIAVLTDRADRAEPLGAVGHRVLQVNLDHRQPWSDQPESDPVHGCHPDHLVYLIYTSGTTGRPKGVAIEHRGLSNLVAWHQRQYQVSAADRATLLASPAFDASVWELWPYLCSGASIHIPDEETRLAPAALLKWLDRTGVTVTFLPTPLVETLLQQEWPPNPHLRFILTGGERLHRRPDRNFGPALINHYGPTEASVVATAGTVEPGEVAGRAPSIGRPISNLRAYCLDPQLRPMPVGVIGELHLSGAGLARGYLNQPELSNQKFVPNPHAEMGHERLYKTGDLVRWLADGRLEFIGRLDQQIKIRGQRVELGEIESVLSEHAAVREVAVQAHPLPGGGSRLVGYIVPRQGFDPAIGELKTWAARKLPQFMRPDTLVLLPALPRTPNGKLDRAALVPGKLEVRTESPAPSTPAEQTIAAVWCEVLGREQVGITDNFFELGGHSLQAMQVMSRIGNLFRADLPLRYLFDAPTVQGLAKKLGRHDKRFPKSAPASATRAAESALVPSFAQERMWFLEQLEPGLPLHNVPLAVELIGELDVAALERSLAEIVRRHKPLRTVFSGQAGQMVLQELEPAPVGLGLYDVSALAEGARVKEIQRLETEHARVPFDLAHGPLLRVRLLRLDPRRHLLLLAMHLIASDGWSVAVFYRELAALYEAFSKGRPSPLPALEMEYSDFARAQRGSVCGQRLESSLAYWKKQLAGTLHPLPLPTDFPRPANQTFNGKTLFFALPPSLLAGLKAVGRSHEATLYMLLLASVKTLLHRYTGSRDICVGSPIAGRTSAQAEQLIGAFVNTLVLRTSLAGNPSFDQLLARVRSVCLGAFAHQEVPLEKLVDALQPRRDPSRHPLFQVMFTFQNTPFPPLELVGLELKPRPLDAGISKFDFTLLLEETPRGLNGALEYNTDLFTETTMTQLLANFQTLLERIVADSAQSLSALVAPLAYPGKPIPAEQSEAGQTVSKEKIMQTETVPIKPGHIRRRAVRMDAGQMVSIRPILAERPGPIMVEASAEGVSLPEWAQANRAQVEQLLAQHRAVLFRNFGVSSVEQFQQCVLATCNGELLNYVDRSTPRPSVGHKVYVSTVYPSAETIHMHNEGTYWRTWPLKIYFCSLVTAEQGGETPIADVRKVFARLAPELREEFGRKQITYVRNYNDGFGLPWQETFQTRDKAEVEAYCRSNDIQFEWKEGDRLRTRQTRPAIRKHPVTGEEVWFNHAAFFHITSLAPQVRDELLSAFGEENLPYNTYYGDGTRIEPDVAASIREAYAAEKLVFPWKNGDVLLLDNMSMAHGRQPYQGRREVVVSMAEPYSGQ